jgi:RNA 2',3'-cyclic 3'-phosphodiesterase
MMERSLIEQSTARSGGGVSLRLFCALPVPQEHARTLASHADLLAADEPDLHPGVAEDLHVTFAFLGEVSEEYVPAIADALDAAAYSIPGPTGCAVRGVDAYGAGRVLAVDVDLELHSLLDRARDQLLDAVRAYAPALDQRPWRPHLSLLRATRGAQLPFVDARVQHQLARLRWVAGELRLFASLPGPTGPTYRQLHVVPFGEHALRE